MKLVSPGLLIEALAARWNSDDKPEMELVADFITDYAKEDGFDIPLQTVLACYSGEADLFNPEADRPFTPGQYKELYGQELSPTGRFSNRHEFEMHQLPRSGVVRGKRQVHKGQPQQIPRIDKVTIKGPLIADELGSDAIPASPSFYQHCPFCGTLATYTHRDGLPVCKCPVNICKGYDRWLEYDDFATLNPGKGNKP